MWKGRGGLQHCVVKRWVVVVEGLVEIMGKV